MTTSNELVDDFAKEVANRFEHENSVRERLANEPGNENLKSWLGERKASTETAILQLHRAHDLAPKLHLAKPKQDDWMEDIAKRLGKF